MNPGEQIQASASPSSEHKSSTTKNLNRRPRFAEEGWKKYTPKNGTWKWWFPRGTSFCRGSILEFHFSFQKVSEECPKMVIFLGDNGIERINRITQENEICEVHFFLFVDAFWIGSCQFGNVNNPRLPCHFAYWIWLGEQSENRKKKGKHLPSKNHQKFEWYPKLENKNSWFQQINLLAPSSESSPLEVSATFVWCAPTAVRRRPRCFEKIRILQMARTWSKRWDSPCKCTTIW